MRDIIEPLRIALGDTTAFGLAVVLGAGDCRKAIDEIEQLRQRIAALEAEKAERERQEPVALAWNDALGCMHVHCGSRRPIWVDGECSDAKRAETSLRPLYAHPPIPRVDPDWLANVIRTVDGNHTMGAGTLAEKIAEVINGRAK